MVFLDLAKERFSVRAYQAMPVPEVLVMQVLEAGRLAPSAANRQPLHLILVQDPQQRKALGEAYPRDWFWKAPAIIVVCIEPARAWTRSDGKNYADVDGAIVMDHMTLCAADLGLGTCWIGAFDAAKVRHTLGVPPGVDPLIMTPLGYPADPPRPKTRKPMGDILRRERW
jgi:nitroreductase